MADLEEVTALLSTRKRRETDGDGTSLRVDAQSAATLARLDASHATLTADERQRNEEEALRRVVVERLAALVQLDGEVEALVRRAAALGEGTVDECEELCEGMAALLELKRDATAGLQVACDTALALRQSCSDNALEAAALCEQVRSDNLGVR
jgi:hypothetical protein